MCARVCVCGCERCLNACENLHVLHHKQQCTIQHPSLLRLQTCVRDTITPCSQFLRNACARVDALYALRRSNVRMSTFAYLCWSFLFLLHLEQWRHARLALIASLTKLPDHSLTHTHTHSHTYTNTHTQTDKNPQLARSSCI